MAQAPTDPDSNTALEGKILQALGAAGGPLKTVQLCRLCRVPKKTLNQVLYRMKAESRVVLAGPALWGLAGVSGPGGPTVQATSSQGQEAGPQRPSDPQPRGCSAGTRLALPPPASPPGPALALPPGPGPQPPGGLSDIEGSICRLLAGGPRKALLIAQGLGRARAKDVNPVLHRMQAQRLLHQDPGSGTWALAQPDDAGGRSRPPVVVIQKQTFNTINHWGPHSHIVVQNPRNIQIGDGTVMVNDSAAVQYVYSDPHDPCDPHDPRDPQDTPTVEKQTEGDAGRTVPSPGPPEDTCTGHESRTVSSPGPAGCRADAGTGDSRRDPSELKGAGPEPPAPRPEDEPPGGQDHLELSARLEAVMLGSPPAWGPRVRQDTSPPATNANGSPNIMEDGSPRTRGPDVFRDTSPRAMDPDGSPQATGPHVMWATSLRATGPDVPEDGGL